MRFSDSSIEGVATHLIAHRSRFEADLIAVGTHGRTEEKKREGVMGGPDRGPREQVPKQKKPDNSLGALFGDLLKKTKPEE